MADLNELNEKVEQERYYRRTDEADGFRAQGREG